MKIELTAGRPETWMNKLIDEKNGDLISCGAEYLLDKAEDEGIILDGSRKSLGKRRSCLVVKIKNPKKINSIHDLLKAELKIGISVDGCTLGIWDEIATRAGITEYLRKNISSRLHGCGALIRAITKGEEDCIFGWNNFKNISPEETEIVELPSELQVFRSTGIAILKFSNNVDLANKFIGFLLSKRGRQIYSKWGWII